MLDREQREDRYTAQTGRALPTKRQARRIRHKAGHQSAAAGLKRAKKSLRKARLADLRKARLAGLISAP